MGIFYSVLDGLPDVEQVIEIVLQVFLSFTDTSGADDDTHAFWQVKIASMRFIPRSLPDIWREIPPPRGLLGINTK